MTIKLVIELTEEQSIAYEEWIEDWLMGSDLFRTGCCGSWMCGVLQNPDKKEWLAQVEDECDEDYSPPNSMYIEDVYLAGLPLSKGYYVLDREKAVKAMNYGIATHGVESWLDGTASDANAVSEAREVAIFGKVMYS
jgi:hypothetical protein